MKNKPCFPLLAAISLVFFLFVEGNATGQSVKVEPFTTDAPFSSNVQVVSARIARMYGADVKIVESYVQAAVNLELRTGIAAPIVIAIAIHESSFTSDLFSNSGNPFAIKASKPWGGRTFSKWHDGEETKFRVYDSVEEAVLDLGSFVKSRSWFADALACPKEDYPCVLNGLKKTDLEPGYSLNSYWDEAVLGIIEKVGLRSLTSR